MKKTYSVWANKGDKIGHTLKEGVEPLVFKNGELVENCELRLYTFEACSYEEAMAIYYIRQGWAPYKPEGEAAECPKCESMYYPVGSGECWNCDFQI